MERGSVESAIKALAEYVVQFADVTAWDVADHWPSQQEQAERRGRIKAVSADMVVLADVSRARPVRYSEFLELLGKLHALGSFPTNDQVMAVADAFHRAENAS